jgi:hypothetical protein
MPMTANTVAGYPMLFPGTRPNSETVSALAPIFAAKNRPD